MLLAVRSPRTPFLASGGPVYDVLFGPTIFSVIKMRNRREGLEEDAGVAITRSACDGRGLQINFHVATTREWQIEPLSSSPPTARLDGRNASLCQWISEGRAICRNSILTFPGPPKRSRSFSEAGHRHGSDTRAANQNAFGDEHMKDGDTIKKERSNNFGRWFETLTPEQGSVHGQRAARALWGPKKEPALKANDGPWVWPIDVNGMTARPR
jgi:hypothetical protein